MQPPTPLNPTGSSLRIDSTTATLGCCNSLNIVFIPKELTMKLSTLIGAVGVAALSACATQTSVTFSQSALPDAVKVPAGHAVKLETTGVGEITYECRAKKDMANQFEWVFVGPDAALNDRSGKRIGKYYGPPATWEAMDGSKITGAQVAVSPANAGSIPLQLVKANPAMGSGAMQGVSYIQRVATQGGVAPSAACGVSSMGQKQIVKYQADYIFWSAV
jgi:hypothetical protein